jgi:CubicO group peptidase (beta-lactamase class C family)
MRYILGRPLEFTPGTQTRYANVGYLVLGLIVEEVSGMDLMDFLELRVLRPLRVDTDDYILGRSFEADKHPREPYYHLPVYAPNVFDPDGPEVLRPYGSFHLEARVGQGAHVTNPRSLLLFLENHHINGPLIGARRGALPPGTVQDHGGTTYGSEATAVQRTDGVNFAVTINQWNMGYSSHATAFYNQLNDFFDTASITWPTRPIEDGCFTPTDLNGDGVVNLFDLALLLDEIGPCGACIDCFADLNGDCQVNFFDLLMMLENWNG